MTERAPSPQTPSVDAALPVETLVRALPAAAAASAQPGAGLGAGAPAPPAKAPPLTELFVQAYRAHFGYVWRVLARLGIRDSDLPDATHDVFVVVHRKLGDFDRSRPMKPWLFGICYRSALDRKRKMSSWREAPVEHVEAVATEPAADEVAAAHQAHAQVVRALSTLELEQRAVFVLHELEGMTMPEIAAIIDAPLNTLYSRLRLARGAFASAVERLRGGTP